MSQRTRTPSDLKWTLNELAALRGEIDRLDQQMARLARRRGRLARIEGAMSEVAQTLAADVALVDIGPVRATTRYGGWGNLRQYLRQTLQAAHPQAVSTWALVEGAARIFGLSFSSREERRRFANDNVGNALRKMLARGEVGRLHDPHEQAQVPGMPGVWRWKSGLPSLESLQVQERARRGAAGADRTGVQ